MDYVWRFEFSDYGEASVAIEKAFKDYNKFRSHSSIDYLPPKEFRKMFLENQLFREKYVKKLEAKLNKK